MIRYTESSLFAENYNFSDMVAGIKSQGVTKKESQ